MNGMRSVVLEFDSTTLPEYSLAAGFDPESVTVKVAVAPAARVTLVGLTATVESLPPGEPFTEQHDTEALSDTDADPMLVRVMVLEIGSVAEFRMPNEMVEGTAVTVAFMAALASRPPAPIHSTSTGSSKSSVVVSCAA